MKSLRKWFDIGAKNCPGFIAHCDAENFVEIAGGTALFHLGNSAHVMDREKMRLSLPAVCIDSVSTNPNGQQTSNGNQSDDEQLPISLHREKSYTASRSRNSSVHNAVTISS